jgi:hypothetical protein
MGHSPIGETFELGVFARIASICTQTNYSTNSPFCGGYFLVEKNVCELELYISDNPLTKGTQTKMAKKTRYN